MRWKIKKVNDEREIQKLVEELKVSELTAKVLANRNISSEEAKALIHSPETLIKSDKKIYGVEKTARKIIELISREEEAKTIFHVFADYDVDGLTSGYIAHTYFNTLYNVEADAYYPDRSEGYGLSINWANNLINIVKAENNPSVKHAVITVDNGITALDAVDILVKANIPVFITDHHEPIDRLPAATSICDPWVGGPEGTHLCGAAVIWKLIKEIESYSYDPNNELIDSYIPYVALGTIADVMPMTAENRAFVALGIKAFNAGKSRFMSTLAKAADINEISIKDISWTLAPCINACSRMGQVSLAVDALLYDSMPLATDAEVRSSAISMIAINEERKRLTDYAVEEAMKTDWYKYRYIIFDASDFPQGIAGIIAGKLSSEYDKPTMVIQGYDSEGIAHASCRAPEGYPLLSMLRIQVAKGNIVMAAGHEEACGAAFYTDKLFEFAKSIREQENELIKKLDIKIEPPALLIDSEIKLDEINNVTRNELKKIPFSKDIPLFGTELCSCIAMHPFRNKNHLVLKMINSKGKTAYAVGWNYAQYYEALKNPREVRIAGTLEPASYSARTLGLKFTDTILMIQDIGVENRI